MTSPHPVPATIDALLALWRGAPSLAYDVDGTPVALRVDDTVALEDFDEPRWLVVGTGAQGAAGGVQATTGFGLADRAYELEVVSELHVWSGATDPAAVRSQAFAVLDELARLLALTPDLGGVVEWARVSRSTYTPMHDGAGTKALIEFTVRVDARRFEGA